MNHAGSDSVAAQGGQEMTPEARVALWRNPATLLGGGVALLALLFMFAFLFLDLASPQRSPYVGLFTYLVFPSVFAFAALLAAGGLLVSRRRFRRRYGSLSLYQLYPRVDLNDPRHRRALGTGGAVFAVTVPVVGLLSYEGYHYTDSNQFCGRVCHTVMEPQFTTFQQSPHAHVGCAECHIGPGASWYVKSKLSGIRQVFAVALDSFPRPIPPAIRELRPATETCRECHWPAKFYGDQLVTIDHFASDEKNTHQQIRMLLKTGGSDPSTGPPSGIHWHMALGFTIEYVATDEHLQEIPWVQVVDHASGRRTVYRSDGKPGSDAPPEGTRRTVDCMDCHNRPTHIFRSPERAADVALHVNAELQSLPFAKRELVAALAEPYPNKEVGLASIATAIARFYRENHPTVLEERADDVKRLTNVAQSIYQTYNFPEMNVSWRTYPDNIGHKIFPGCFRCHEGRHVDDTGKSISRECGTCHEFLVPASTPAGERSVVRTGGFVHPVELQGAHAMMRCDKCHTGGPVPAATCAGCHTEQNAFRNGTSRQFRAFSITADAMAAVDCEACHDLTAPKTHEAMNERCQECHDDDWEKYEITLTAWKTEAEQLLSRAERRASPTQRELLNQLRAAGPLHNMEATRRITAALAGTEAAGQEP